LAFNGNRDIAGWAEDGQSTLYLLRLEDRRVSWLADQVDPVYGFL